MMTLTFTEDEMEILDAFVANPRGWIPEAADAIGNALKRDYGGFAIRPPCERPVTGHDTRLADGTRRLEENTLFENAIKDIDRIINMRLSYLAYPGEGKHVSEVNVSSLINEVHAVRELIAARVSLMTIDAGAK